ncbi:MAG: tRNA glutamyl-Q(34) synthetase GluQRS [Victivallales bacterium]|nr:tRNA glutamyl-Q(34) synthetase GluQRS [Victivallales bacterium]
MPTDPTIPLRGRLAPSPTGALHLGNARTFLIAWLSIRSRGGKLVMRLEDLDHPKVKPAAADAACRDLRQLGLDWDEGDDCGGPHHPYRQSRRIAVYRAALAQLRAAGLVYPCTCTRRDVTAGQSAPHAGDYHRYSGRCRHRYPDFPAAMAVTGPRRLPAWRFIAPDRDITFVDGCCGPQTVNIARTAGDFVLARHPDGAGYQLAVVVDDAMMQITEIVRGDDLLPCTAWQILLYEALEYPVPTFIHVPLVVGPDGKRLAKRHGDTRISELLQRGNTPEKIIGLLAWSCGWAEFGEALSPADLLPRFSWSTIPRQPLVIDDRLNRYLGLTT